MPAKFSRVIKRLVYTGVYLYVASCLLLYIFQRQIIYHPTSAYKTHDQLWSLPEHYEPWLQGTNLLGYKRVTGSTNCLFFLHGNGGNARGWAFATKDFPGDVYVLEYPGYGERTGTPSEVSLKAAATAAFDSIPPQPHLVLCGQSLGTGVTPAIFQTRHIDQLVLITPFTSLKDVGACTFPLLPTRLLQKDTMSLYPELEKYTGPTSIILAEKDEVIPWKARQPFIQPAPNHQVIIVPNARHNSIHLSTRDWLLVTTSKF